MAIDFDEDLEELLSEDDLGVKFTVSGTEYEGVLTRKYLEQEGGEEGIASADPVLYVRDTVKSSASITRDTQITIGSETFIVVNIMPNGRGMSLLQLELT